MPTSIAVLSADTHLAQRAWAKYPGLEGDAYFSLSQITDYCSQNKLPLILAGDVFDKTRPDPNTILHTRQAIDVFIKSELPFYFIQGQHERDKSSPWLSAISSFPIHIHGKAVIIAGINFYGIDWTPAVAIEEQLTKIPSNVDVLVSHQVWRDIVEHTATAECSFSQVPFAKVVLTGDLHRHFSVVLKNTQDKPLVILSPGSTCMQSIVENPKKSFYVLNDDLTFKSIPFKTRNCFRVELNNEEDLDLLIGSFEILSTPQTDVPDIISKNIVEVRYIPDIQDVYTRITSKYGNKVHLFLTPVHVRPDDVYVDISNAMKYDNSLTSYLHLAIDKASPLFRDLSTLIESNDPTNVMNEIHENFISTNHDRKLIRSN